MKNSKVNEFETEMNEELNRQISEIGKYVDFHLSNFEKIKLIKFDNQQEYSGEISNTIFFTYSDHYRGNGGVWMSVGQLNHAHRNMDDRGYIKGVATDLEGYMKLRSASNLNHNFENVVSIYYPQFNNTKHKEDYVKACDMIVANITRDLNQLILVKKEQLNARLKELTECSLLHYLRNI